MVQTYYLSCYSELSRCRRSSDSGPLPLAVAEIRDYFEVFDLIDFESFFDWIKLIDDIWLDEVAASAKRKEAKLTQHRENAPIPRAK